ncbi:MAG TPA: BatA domain-containing protein, partial [Verrucomicrobiae bacterium]
MSFLNSTLLAALIPLLALPLLIHLLNKRFPKLFYFSSVEALKQTVAQRSTLFRLRHLILLLLRTLFLVLLLCAFLKPVLQKFGSGQPAGGERHVLILLDHSMSMEHKGEALSARKRALLEAEKLIHALAPNDLLNVMLVGQNPTTCFVDFSAHHAEAVRFLNALKPGLTRADFNKANAAAARHLGKVTGRSEIYYLSDFQRKNWANVDFTSLPPNARMFFIDVAAKTRDNHAILGAAINQQQVLAGDTVTLEVTVGNFSGKPLNDRLTVLL